MGTCHQTTYEISVSHKEPTQIGHPGGLCRRGDTGTRRGKLCKGLGVEHSRQRTEQNSWELFERQKESLLLEEVGAGSVVGEEEDVSPCGVLSEESVG